MVGFAADTRDKLGSAIGEFSFLEVLPSPSNDPLDVGDKQQLCWVFRSDFAAEPVDFVAMVNEKLSVPILAYQNTAVPGLHSSMLSISTVYLAALARPGMANPLTTVPALFNQDLRTTQKG